MLLFGVFRTLSIKWHYLGTHDFILFSFQQTYNARKHSHDCRKLLQESFGKITTFLFWRAVNLPIRMRVRLLWILVCFFSGKTNHKVVHCLISCHWHQSLGIHLLLHHNDPIEHLQDLLTKIYIFLHNFLISSWWLQNWFDLPLIRTANTRVRQGFSEILDNFCCESSSTWSQLCLSQNMWKCLREGQN